MVIERQMAVDCALLGLDRKFVFYAIQRVYWKKELRLRSGSRTGGMYCRSLEL
jgi:hypothetical protein